MFNVTPIVNKNNFKETVIFLIIFVINNVQHHSESPHFTYPITTIKKSNKFHPFRRYAP